MNFELIPVLENMALLYKMPPNRHRFETYLSMLQGSSSEDMKLPITSYNPMGNSLVLKKIETLINIDAEQLAGEALKKINDSFPDYSDKTIGVVLSVSDDLGGAWSHRYETDYSSKFKIGPLVKRSFCTPHFWTSEDFHDALVVQRTTEYAYRTIYWLEHAAPVTLAEHVQQELYVHKNSGFGGERLSNAEFVEVNEYFSKHRHAPDYNLIFNFFYGDGASSELGYYRYGLPQLAGIRYLSHLE